MRLYFSNKLFNQGDTPMEYFKLYWHEYIELLLDNKETEVRLESPRLTVLDLAAEIRYNALKNGDNAAYFKAMLGKWLKADQVFNELCREYTTFALQNFSSQYCKLLFQTCSNIINVLDSRSYFEGVLSRCSDYINEQKDLTASSKGVIRRYVHILISELLAKNYALKDIQESGKTGISGIMKFAKAEAEDAYAIVRLFGIRGALNEHLNEVHIYNPRIYQYITDSQMSFTKIEQVADGDDIVNAAVKIKFKSVDSAKIEVKKRLSMILELLTLNYSTKTQICFDDRNFAVVIDGRERSASFSIASYLGAKSPQSELLDKYHSLDADGFYAGKDLLIERFGKIYLQSDETSNRLRNAIHWGYKAEYSLTDEERLLHSWYLMEGLLKVDEETKSNMFLKSDDGVVRVIQTVVSSVLSVWHDSIYWKESYISTREDIELNGKNDILSEDLIRRSSLDTPIGTQINVEAFKSCLKELENSISNELQKDRLSACRDYYESKDGFSSYYNEIENDVLMIYRLRNLIAHNAVVPEGAINLYARKARFMSHFITCYILDKYESGKMIEKILIEAVLAAKLKSQRKS